MSERMLRALASIVTVVALIVGLLGPMSHDAASAAVDDCSKWWDGGAGNGSWHDALNWVGDVAPVNGDVVCIPAGETAEYSAGSLSIGGAEVDGKLIVSGGSLSVDDEAVVKDLRLWGGTLTGAGLLSVTNSLSWTGGEMAGSGTLNLESTVTADISETAPKTLGRHLRNLGHLTWTDGDILMGTNLGRDANIENLGTFTIAGDDSAYLAYGSDYPSITNQAGATIGKTGTATANLGTENVNFTNDGTVSVAGGTLGVGAFPNNGTIRLAAGARLAVAGGFTGASGRIEVDIAGTGSTGYGALTVAGTADLGGTLAATLVGGFTPAPGNEFTIVDAEGLSGTFASVEGPLVARYDEGPGNVVLMTNPYPGCTTVFAGSASNLWHDPANWSAGEVPSGDDTACIPEGLTAWHQNGTSTVAAIQGAGRLEVGDGTLSVTGTSSIAELLLSGGTITGDGELTVATNFTWFGGTLAGAGTLVVGPSARAEWVGNGQLGRHLRNDGAMTWSDGRIELRSDLGGVAHIDNYGSFSIYGNDDTPWWYGPTPPQISNRPGAWIGKYGSATAQLGADDGGFVNDGTVSVNAGTLTVYAGSGGGSGNWEAAAGANLQFDSRQWDLTGNVSALGTITADDTTLRVSGSGRYGTVAHTVVGEAILDIDSTPAQPNETAILQVGGYLWGDGDLTVTQDLQWTSGNIEGTGALIVAAGATGTLGGSQKGLGRHLRNHGMLTWSAGTIYARTDNDNHPHLDNYGTFDITGNVGAEWIAGTTPPLYTNRPGGLLRKSGSWTTTGTFGGGDFSNEGAVRVEGGATLNINATVAQISGNTLTGGKWEVVEGTLMVKDLSVVTNQAEIVLWGCCNLIVDDAYNDALTGTLVNNQGIVSLHLRSLDVSPGFSNSGTIRLDPWSRIDAPDGYSQSSSGRLVTEISGLEPDGSNGRVETNLASLDGTLEAVLVPPEGQVDPYEPGPGDAFTVVSADVVVGAFSSVEGPLAAEYDYDEGDVVLSTGGGGPTCTVTWDGGANNGLWTSAANWSPDVVPGASDTACIPSGASVTYSTGTSSVGAVFADGSLTVSGGSLAIAGASSVRSLTVSGGTLDGTGDIAVTATLNYAGSATLAGPGTLTITPTATATITGTSTKVLSRHLLNQGHLVWSAGSIALGNQNGGAGHLDNTTTIEITAAATISTNSGTTGTQITNHPGATITKTATGTTTLGNNGTAFTNSGTIETQNGTLRADGVLSGLSGTTLTGGTWIVAEAAALRIRNADVVTNAASITLGGPNAVLADQNGTNALRNFATNNGTLSLQGKDLSVPGSLTNSGTLALGPGTDVTVAGGFTQTATGRFEASISSNVSGTGFPVVTAGTASVDGTIASTLAGGFTPSPTDSFRVIDAVSVTGTFSSVEGPLSVEYDTPNGDVILGAVPTTCNVSWDGSAGDGRWDTAANWSTDAVPGPADWVCIPEGSTANHSTGASTVGAVTAEGTLRVSGGTLTIGGDSSISKLEVAGGGLDGSGAVTVQDRFDWTGGAINGSGDLRLAASASGSISNNVGLARHLLNEGTLIWQGGILYLTEAAGVTAHLDNHATLEIRNGETATRFNATNTPQITNRPGATITKTATGTTTLGSGGTEFTNDGTVRSAAGLLRVGGANASGGPGAWIADANLTLHTGTWELTGPVSGPGQFSTSGATVRVTGSNQVSTGELLVTGGSLDLDNDPDGGNTTATLTIQAGTFDGDADLTITQTMTWTGGAINGSGDLRLAASASGSISNNVGLARHLLNEGTLIWQGGILYLTEAAGVTAHLDNHATLEIRNGETATRFNATNTPQITNRPGATITKTATGTTTLGSGGTEFTNDGAVDVAAGTLSLDGHSANVSGTTLNGGTWAVADGAALRIRDADVATNAASISLGGASATLADHNGTNALRNLATNNGTLTLQGKDLALPGSLTNSGTLRVGSGSEMTLGGGFVQTATGRFEEMISGPAPETGFGSVVATGAATLDGTLATTLVGGYVPGAADAFLVIDAVTLSGTFANVEGGLAPRYSAVDGTVTLGGEEPVLPVIAIDPQSASEATGTFVVLVRGIGGNTPATVPLQITAGTASAVEDYSTAFTPTTVTVNPDGVTPVSVTLLDDALDEDDETFAVSAGGTAGTMTILDDDLPPTVVIDGLSITEGDNGSVDAVLMVRLVDPVLGLLPQASGRTVTVGASTHDGTAVGGSDFAVTDDIVVFDPGVTTRTFVVPILGDETDEDDEQFTVSLANPLNATVPPGENATVTIVDDDGSGGSAAVRQELEDGGAALFDVLDDWGGEYDLDRSAPSPFELPGLTDELASLYEPQDDLAALGNPFAGLDDDLDALCGQLQARGLTIDWIEGGVCGQPAPPTDADIIQVRFTTTISNLPEALAFVGDEFNDQTEGILDGLVSSLGLDADFTSGAELTVTLVVGVDEDGFYVSNESGLRLDVDATATVAGVGNVAGVDGLNLQGPASVDVSVLLAANGGPARLRAADLAAPPSSYLRPAAEGTVGLHLDATLDPLALRWDSTSTLSIDSAFATDITVDARLEGTLTLPGLTDGGDPATIEMVGTFNGTTWTLSGDGASGAEYALHGFDVDELAFEVVLSPTAFTGTAAAVLHTDLAYDTNPVDIAITAGFDHTAVHAQGHVDVGEVTLGPDPGVAYMAGVSVDAGFDTDIATGTTTGGVTVSADTIVAFPETAGAGTIPAGAARADGVTGTLSGDGILTLHADTLTARIGDAIDIAGTGVDISLGEGATGPLLSIPTATATIPSLNGLGVTFTGLHINRDGTWGADGIGVASQGFLQTIGLGGILPFDITEVSIEFPNHEDLDSFEVRVTGHFDFAALAALPFTPVIGIGGEAVTPSSPPEDNAFTFSIAVESLSEGKVRPWDLGPITLGFEDLTVGDVTLGAQITLGAYDDGVWTGDACGSLSILGGLDDIEGEAAVDVCGSLAVTSAGAALDLDGTFEISANLGGDIRFEGASLDFDLGVAVDEQWNFTITGPTFSGVGVDRVEIVFGEFMRFVGTEIGINLSGDPLISVGGQPCPDGVQPPCDGSATVEFNQDFEALAGWGGEVGNFAVGTDLVPRLLPGFFFNLHIPDDERFGLPDWLPLRIDEFGIRFPNVDLANIPPGGIPITDLAAFTITFSGGFVATEQWPISAEVDRLEVDLGKLVRGEFPINLPEGFRFGVEPFELAPGFKVGGGLELRTIPVDGDPAPGEQTEDVFYGRVFGQFEYEGFGAGIDLVITRYGPVLAKVLVPVGVPIDGGLLGGVILSGVQGGIRFGGDAFPDPARPLEILHDPAFDTDFPINDDTIRDSVEPAVQQEKIDPNSIPFTWDNGFTVALSGKLTHAMAPAIVTGDVTIGMNVGLIPGQQGVKFIGSGDISVWGMDFAGAALLLDLQNPLEPKFDFAFATPQPGNPLGFVLPAQAELEASIDTTGMLPGFGLGVGTFIDRLTAGSLDVGQEFFDTTVDTLVWALEHDHSRALARLVLDTDHDGRVSADENAAVITRDSVLYAVKSWLAAGPGGLPSDLLGAAKAGRIFAAELLGEAKGVLDRFGSFDLADVATKADYMAFAQILGAGGEAIAALLGVVRDSVLRAGDAFMSQFDPSVKVRGMLQPVVLGIPFGEPQHEVELLVSKQGISFGFDTSFMDIAMRVCAAMGPSGLGCNIPTWEDRLGMTFELPLTGVVEGLFGGSGVPAIDPWSGAWAIELRGGFGFGDFDVGQMIGLIVASDNATFVDAHVQKLWENPDAPLDPDLIPIQAEQHYRDIVEYGGILLTGRLLLPELLVDPAGLMSELNLEVPEDITEIPDWISAINDHLGRVSDVAHVQYFLPGFDGVFQTNFDAPTEAERIFPVLSGQPLADAVNRILGAAYVEGTYDGTLLGVPFGRARIENSQGRIAVEGVHTLTGLHTRFDLDMNPVLGRDGPVDMPRAIASVAITDDELDGVLTKLGLPPIITAVADSEATFRAVSPGYDPASDEVLLRRGGIELSSRLAIAGLVDDAAFRIAVTPPSGAGLPDLVGHAEVGQIGPLGGVSIRDASIDIVQQGGHLSVGIDGTADILGATARVHGTLNPDLTGSLQVTFESGGPRLFGFDISTGFVLSLTRSGGTLVATLSFDGEVVFPSWLSVAAGRPTAHASGTISSDGTIDLALDINSLILFGFPLRSGTFHVVGNESNARMTIDAKLDFLGATLDVDGDLQIGAGGPTGTLALSFSSGSALAFGPVSVRGTLALVVGAASANVSATGTADIPGIATGVGISGSVTSAGTGSLSLTAQTLGIKGFNVTRLTTGNPIPSIATITRTLVSTTMAVDARFNFLGSALDVDGSLLLAAGGPSGSLALTLNGSANIPFGGWTFEGGVTMAVAPTAASIAVNSRIDIPGIANNLAVSGSLDTTLRGSLTVTAGSLRLGPPGSPFSISGTFTLSRTGSPAVIALTASGVTLTWTGVTTFSVNTFSIGSDGHFDASVSAKAVTVSQFSWSLPSFNLHVGAGGTGVQLQIGQSSLTITNLGTLTVPGVNIDTTANFSLTLAATHLDLSALDLDGRLIFERQSGVFRLRVTGLTASTLPHVAIPGLATLTVNAFTISSDGTFDVAATSTRIGPDALSIRNASIRVRKTGTALSTISVAVNGGRLYLPVGNPITLPNIAIDGDASWTYTFTASGINLGPALQTTNDPSFTLSLSGGVLQLSLNSPLGISVLADSIGMSLRSLTVASDGTFEGTVRGRLAVFGYVFARTNYQISLSNGVVRMRIPASSPVTVDLGPVDGSVSGSVYSDGTFDFSGSAAVDLTLAGVGLRGTASVRLRTSGLSGSFTGQACVLVCIDVVGGSINSNGVLRLVIAGITYRIQLFDPPQ